MTLVDLETGSNGNDMGGPLGATFTVRKRSHVRIDISGDKRTIDETLVFVYLKVRGPTFSQYIDSLRTGATSMTLEQYDKMLRRVWPRPSLIVEDETLDIPGPATCRGVLRGGVLYEFDLAESCEASPRREVRRPSGVAGTRGDYRQTNAVVIWARPPEVVPDRSVGPTRRST